MIVNIFWLMRFGGRISPYHNDMRLIMLGHENASEYFKCTIKKEVGNSLSFFSFCSLLTWQSFLYTCCMHDVNQTWHRCCILNEGMNEWVIISQ